MSALLSREALALLELLPAWQLRPHLQPVAQQRWGEHCTLLVIGVASTPTSKQLWANINKAVHALGFAENMGLQTEMLSAVQPEQALRIVMQEKPARLLVLGEALEQGLLALSPEIQQACQVQGLAGLESIAGSASHKQSLWRALAALKRERL